MNHKEYVLRNCEMLGLDVIKPTRAAPGILVHDWSVKPTRLIVDAHTWAQARTQLIDWARKRTQD